MTNYYHFVDGLLEPCTEAELEQTGGQRFLSNARVAEYSEGKYNKSGWIAASVQSPTHYGSDDLGVQGILNHADGKRYDSKSAYYKSLKAQGMVVMGDEAPKKAKPRPESNIDWKQAVRETLNKTPKKGKS